jgi:hypothetical protein
MDLYSTDGADISAGSMRHSQMEDIARNYQAHNDLLIGELAQKQRDLGKKSQGFDTQLGQLTEGNYIEGAKNLIGGVIQSHGLNSGIKSFNAWSGARAEASKTIQNARQNLIQNSPDVPEPILKNESSVTTPVNRPEGANAGSTNGDVVEHNTITAGADDAGGGESLVKEGIESGTSKIAKGLKVAGGLTSVVSGGVGLYEDFKSGSSSNGWEKAGDVFSTLGGVEELGGIGFAPLEAVGAVTSLIGSGLDEIGSLFESDKDKQELKQKKAEAQKQQQQAQAQLQEQKDQVASVQTTASAPQVAISRSQ